ncbi:hypothetical protein LCGC14_0225350 [marine sediment metagenome]|uniref:Uncharacterized AAA domain-containing protein ycf46 n=1 Tax=marine sediment metagenome TaxID=412755 RepID=A0A0F9WX29_9ZZZZ
MNEKKMKEIKEIDILIRARYPLIYVVSSEEDRVIQSINDITRRSIENSPTIYVWSLVCGIRELKDITTVNTATMNPIEALHFINNIKKRGIFILLDFHAFMIDSNPEIVRYLRELNKSLKLVQKNVVIIAPELSIPSDLEKDITVIDFPLPDKDEINDICNTVAESVKDDARVETNGKREHVIKALMGLNTNEIENVLYKSLIQNKNFSVNTIIKEKEQIIRKTGILEYTHTTNTLEDVGGNDILMKWIIQRKNAFTDKARDFGLPYPKGMLLLGVQGCGKSLICKIVANVWNFPLLRMDMSAIFEGIVGSSERNMSAAIQLAKACSPCVLWIDEIEKALGGSGSSNFSDGGTTSRVIGSFLTFLQENQAPIFVVATANDITNLPPELLRKGRLDEIFFVDLPNEDERFDIFRIHLTKRKRDFEQFDLPSLIDNSVQYSGAEIEASIVSGLFDAYDDGVELDTDYIMANLKRSIPLSKTMAEPISKMRLWARDRARPTTSNKEIPKSMRLDL